MAGKKEGSEGEREGRNSQRKCNHSTLNILGNCKKKNQFWKEFWILTQCQSFISASSAAWSNLHYLCRNQAVPRKSGFHDIPHHITAGSQAFLTSPSNYRPQFSLNRSLAMPREQKLLFQQRKQKPCSWTLLDLPTWSTQGVFTTQKPRVKGQSLRERDAGGSSLRATGVCHWKEGNWSVHSEWQSLGLWNLIIEKDESKDPNLSR